MYPMSLSPNKLKLIGTFLTGVLSLSSACTVRVSENEIEILLSRVNS